jgi:hypothetical protein
MESNDGDECAWIATGLDTFLDLSTLFYRRHVRRVR